jgi:hypothetical protein
LSGRLRKIVPVPRLLLGFVTMIIFTV